MQQNIIIELYQVFQYISDNNNIQLRIVLWLKNVEIGFLTHYL